jgi:hypothetical protein
MTEQPKQIPSSNVLTAALLAFVAGGAIGFGISRWQINIARNAATAISEVKWVNAMSEEMKHIQGFWDSKPEVARALLERQLRAEERMLQSERAFGRRRFLLTEDTMLRDMGIMHMRLAILCHKTNEPDCVSQHVNEAARLMNISSNEVWAAMAKFEETDRSHRQTANE